MPNRRIEILKPDHVFALKTGRDISWTLMKSSETTHEFAARMSRVVLPTKATARGFIRVAAKKGLILLHDLPA